MTELGEIDSFRLERKSRSYFENALYFPLNHDVSVEHSIWNMKHDTRLKT